MPSCVFMHSLQDNILLAMLLTSFEKSESVLISLFKLSLTEVELQYLVRQRTHRGASWASGAAQAAQFVRSILRFCGELLGLRGGLTRLEKPEIFNSQNSQTKPLSPTPLDRRRLRLVAVGRP